MSRTDTRSHGSNSGDSSQQSDQLPSGTNFLSSIHGESHDFYEKCSVIYVPFESFNSGSSNDSQQPAKDPHLKSLKWYKEILAKSPNGFLLLTTNFKLEHKEIFTVKPKLCPHHKLRRLHKI